MEKEKINLIDKNLKNDFMELDYEIVSEFIFKGVEKIEYICNKHKDKGILKIQYYKFKKGQRCRFCGYEKIAALNRFSIEKVREIFEEKNCILITDYYENQKTILEYICLSHEELGIQYTSLQLYNTNKHGCPQCFKDSTFYTYDFVKRKFEERNLVLLDTRYIGCEDYLKYICPQHADKGIMKIQFYELIRGRGCNHCAYEKIGEKNSEELHYNWKGGIYDQEKDIFRRSYKTKNWRKQVYKRDDFACQCCGKIGGRLNAHHLDGYNWCVEKRTDIENGVTLCEGCHINNDYSFHRIYGSGRNTKEEFVEWIKEYGLINEYSNTIRNLILNTA